VIGAADKRASGTVGRSLAAHSWLGLLAGALMYIVCLSGTLAVFYPDLERWEQPYAPEFRDYDAELLDRAFNDYVAGGGELTPHMYLVLPTDEVPRARIATENESWFLDAAGEHAGAEQNGWTEMLLDLHLYLHLPHSWGMLVVSALGALLLALIVSGIIAHPRIFRDAFNLRLKGSRHLEQADIHNRLSVWGAPFHVVIAITGAWFGFALPFLGLSSQAFFDGDTDAAVEEVFGHEPELAQPPTDLGIATALDTLETLAPDAEPLFVVVHDAGEPGQFMSISVLEPKRLVYAENYLFDARGRFLRTDGISDGAPGKQLVYSIYRLHFGHFLGLPVKLLYGVLGLALTVVAASGVNVWLARRRTRDSLNLVWPGIVWGLPVGLALAAAGKLAFGLPPAWVLWPTVLVAMFAGLALRDEFVTRRYLLAALAASLVAVVAAELFVFGPQALGGAALVVNLLLTAMAGALALLLLRTRKGPTSVPAPAAVASAGVTRRPLDSRRSDAD